MIITKEVEIGCSSNKQYYIDKGYTFPTYINKNGVEYTKRGTKIPVKVSDLPQGSNAIVTIKCDICGELKNTTYQAALRYHDTDGLYRCRHCNREKFKETMLEKYNVENPSQLDDVKRKKEETTMLHYNVQNPFQSEDVKEKIKQTNLLKYGVENPIHCNDIFEKMINSKYDTQGQMCSSQQLYISKLFDLPINYPIKRYSLDLFDSENNIDIEYDGGAHNLSVKLGTITQEEFDKKEMIREKELRSVGIKIMRIILPHDKLPSDDKLIEMYEFAKNYFATGHTWINFYVEENKYRNAEHQNIIGAFYDFGTLWNGKMLAKKQSREVNEVT